MSSNLVGAICTWLLLVWFAAGVQAFNFTYSPTFLDSCGSVTVSWTDGSAPFYLLAVPVFGTPRNFSIPDSAYSNGQGSFTTQVKFPQAQRYVLIMSDSTGFGKGGISPILQTTNTTAGSCNTTDTGPFFTFELNDNLAQCRSFTFDNYTNAIQPVEIMGIIPGGQPFVLSPPNGPTSYTWDSVDIWNGTTTMFMMVDSKQNEGGASGTFNVGVSDDSSCISSGSPSATASQFAPTSSSSGSSSRSSSNNLGAILGSVLGGVLILATVIAMTLFFLRRRKERKDPNGWIEASGAYSRRSRARSDDIDLLADVRDPTNPTSPTPFLPSSQYGNQLSHSSAAPYHSSYSLPSSAQYLPAGTEVTPFTATSDEHRTTQRTTKGPRGPPSNAQPRYIVHHDAEDVPEEEAEEVVELPPQYSERRAPQSQISTSSSSGPSGSTFDRDRKNPYPS
ncbi:hypothetical protein GYMLUDRAFT_66124 [Collybiopsis luxurians FD-317 M1]|nr:hypothetical protein GYMLUDRAFT_66124 [Collybiopsis luxurians FD-317 M1]